MSKEKSIKSSLNNLKNQKNKTFELGDFSDKDLPKIRCKPEFKEIVNSVVKRLAKSEKGQFLLKEAKKNGVTITMTGGTGRYGEIDEVKKLVVIDKAFSDDALVGTLAHELRHAYQFFSRGAMPELESQNTKTYLMRQRAGEADAESYAVGICCDLAEQGDKGPLTSIQEISPMITKAYLNNIEDGENAALFAGFKAWYQDTATVNVYDENYLNCLENLNDYELEQCTFSKNLPSKKIVDMMCVNGDKNYFSDKPEVLEKPEYLSISSRVKKYLGCFFEEHKYEYGVNEKTHKKLEIRKLPKLKFDSARKSQEKCTIVKELTSKKKILMR